MADNSMELTDFLRKAVGGGDVDFLREGVRVLSQALMELEVSEQIGAGRHERSCERTTHRNGYRERTWDTAAGAIELKDPEVTRGQLHALAHRAEAPDRPRHALRHPGGVDPRGLDP